MLSDSLDANIIIHGIIDSPSCQRKKIWKFLSTAETTHRVFDLAISEAVYALDTFYDQSRREIAENLTLFFEQFEKHLDYNRMITKMILPFWVKHPSLSFNDCCLGFYAEFENVEPIITLDKKLASQHPSAKLLA